ncbi:hypothetical protein [Pseudomonas aeruginosa]|uniref:hypothetical protein n=1 Tax=Pseudomonas aeruginosa TaxID=287 RepID=UPI0021F171DA|nr:hypothetical protein [Pseudomonas aeruginosa]MCV6403835.1 hypothetical protein [Pseudomonas aeruginosa]
MTESKICTCPSGDGSLRHPCPAHPAVEQAGGDERAAFEAYRDRRNALLESEGHNPGSKWHVTNAHYPTWEASRAALAQPSPAQAEQAEPERPEVVAWQYRVTAGPQTGWSLWHPGKGEEFERSYTVERRPLMTVAQYDRIVGELRAVIAQLRQHKNDYMDSGQETYRALQNEIREREAEIARLDGLVSGRTAERDAANARLHEVATACATAEQERDAALARVAELERQQPVAWMHDQPNRVDVIHRDVKDLLQRVPGSSRGIHRPLDVSEHYTIPLYAAPVAQAQHSVPEGWMLVPVEPLLNMMSDKDHDTRITAERQLLSILAAAPGKEGV